MVTRVVGVRRGKRSSFSFREDQIIQRDDFTQLCQSGRILCGCLIDDIVGRSRYRWAERDESILLDSTKDISPESIRISRPSRGNRRTSNRFSTGPRAVKWSHWTFRCPVRFSPFLCCLLISSDLHRSSNAYQCRSIWRECRVGSSPSFSLVRSFSRWFRCGYVLMPKYIRSGEEHGRKLELVSKLLSIRVIAVRHLRAHQAKSISKAIVKTTIISKQRTAEHQTCQSKSIEPWRVFSWITQRYVIFTSNHPWTLRLWRTQILVETSRSISSISSSAFGWQRCWSVVLRDLHWSSRILWSSEHSHCLVANRSVEFPLGMRSNRFIIPQVFDPWPYSINSTNVWTWVLYWWTSISNQRVTLLLSCSLQLSSSKEKWF